MSNNGGEYRDKKLKEFCATNGIKLKRTTPETPQQNGVVEYMNRTLNKHARIMRIHASLSKMFQAEAISIAAYLINYRSQVPLKEKSHDEVQIDKEVNFSHLRIFGCISYVHIDSYEKNKST